jgi:hypothetical protein
MVPGSGTMALSAVECPGGVCHSHHGGHAVEREQLRANLAAHGPAWCERLAERVYEISVDSFSQTVMPHLHQAGWQRRHLDWEFKLQPEPAEAERTLVDGAINAVESFLRSSEVQRLFVQELVQGTLAETEANGLQRDGVRRLIEAELLALLQEQRDGLLDRVAEALLENAAGDFEQARGAAAASLEEVQALLLNHAEAVG